MRLLFTTYLRKMRYLTKKKVDKAMDLLKLAFTTLPAFFLLDYIKYIDDIILIASANLDRKEKMPILLMKKKISIKI